ncbi:MAG TPA: MarR family transcriptional regulator [Jiangellaceae bacterium]|nr:MarR family transcriptional regulator [Jiangellaceae bacterium]
MDVSSDSRITAFGLFVEVQESLTAKVRPNIEASGISYNEFELLLRLVRSPQHRLRMSDLAAQTTLTTSGITRVVDRLQRSGLVERVNCDTDRRGTWAEVTEAGRELMGATLPTHLADIEKWFTGLLSEDQVDTLVDTLRVLRTALRPDAVAGG